MTFGVACVGRRADRTEALFIERAEGAAENGFRALQKSTLIYIWP
jgi:methylphosphotriester-DNA--protein-cysteine methyltransferase